MHRLMFQLSRRQRKFILYGDEHLKPQTRAALAEELGVHESTVSRAVSDKSVQLPNGRIIPMNKFFDRSLPVRTTLRKIIESETEPLTDSQLAHKLTSFGFRVARRTVAKYRSMEGILPSHLRRDSER
jgi:RNA polymerase sigma-54 factor